LPNPFPTSENDRLLAFLVKMTNDSESELDFIELPVMLNVHGLTITGNLIKPKKYFAKMSEILETFETRIDNEDYLLNSAGVSKETNARIINPLIQKMKDTTKEFMVKMMKEEEAKKEEYDACHKTTDSVDDDSKDSQYDLSYKPAYIHLANVRVLTTSAAMSTALDNDLSYLMTVWRGKISSIDGFAIGNIQPKVTSEAS
jgi:hypothetical protein